MRLFAGEKPLCDINSLVLLGWARSLLDEKCQNLGLHSRLVNKLRRLGVATPGSTTFKKVEAPCHLRK